MLLKERQKGQEDEGGDVRTYWTIFRKREDTGIWHRKYYITFYDIAVEEDMDLSQDRLFTCGSSATGLEAAVLLYW